MRRLGGTLVALLALGVAAPRGEVDERRSGATFMSAETRALQADDTANPGMLWVADGEALWSTPDGASRTSCATCHGDARVAMRGVAARYPAIDAAGGGAVDLQGRINLCRTRHMGAAALPLEQHDLLALATFVGHQSRGLPLDPPPGPAMDALRDHGRRIYTQRQGQLDLSCAGCHDANWGRRLGAVAIPQAHPTGYPIYRLEWQGVGSLQRRVRGCLVGVRAEPWPYGAGDAIALEAYLAWQARGMTLETPAVRP
jgi:L-cysteine S-thiosulfotransferase